MVDAVTFLSQRAPEWAYKHYGLPQASAASTIGAYGCGITAIAQKITLLGFTTTPPEVQSALVAAKAFRNFGSFNFIDWARVPLAFPRLAYSGRQDYPNPPAPARVMEMIYARLLRNDPVIVYVDAQKYVAGLQQHFVLALAVQESGDLIVANPWTGTAQNLRAYAETDSAAVRGVIWLDQKFDASKAI